MIRKYEYKTKKALMQNMQRVDVEQDSEHITFIPSNHESVGWHSGDGMEDKLKVIISANSIPKII
ncbi:MAG: DUF1436 family protein [Alphaproteobacteria bacterium]|nr:DUF1436 family protein [Alphaproteobacteria bacterium]